MADEIVSTKEIPVTPSDIEWYAPEWRDVSVFFNIEDREGWESNRERIFSILEWAKDRTGSKDRLDWLLEVRKLEREFGGGHSNKERLANLYKFVRLDHQKQQIDKQIEIIKGNGTRTNSEAGPTTRQI